MRIKKIRSDMEQKLSSIRFKHSLGVAETAVKLAYRYQVNIEHAEIAGLLHDCAKDYRDQDLLLEASKFDIIIKDIWHIEPQLLHGPVGAFVARRDYPRITDDIFNAIYYHTTGRAGMSNLEKIIYVADIIEPNREFPGVETLRSLIGKTLDMLTARTMDSVIEFLIADRMIIDTCTIEARNQLYSQFKSK